SSFQYAAYKDFGSNNWAVNGFRTHNTSALLANDPHLTTEVPSIWLGFQLVSPVQNVVGVVFPGFPGIVLGHNPKVAWGATNGQVQQIYYYAETMKSGSSTQYLNNGSYSPFSVINENISVAGGSTYQLKVMRAVNGVILYTGENTIAMD
ncbi:Peptidase S45, penicillin amidase, partial [mine drainage metagenome]